MPLLDQQIEVDFGPRRHFVYQLTVTDQDVEIVRELEILRPLFPNSHPEKYETIDQLLNLVDRIKSENDFLVLQDAK